ncbi:hypothetical protein SKAU_G00139650 [Synaphobranchus kaupii]|uniref:Uncharacterized protein n=1 Tax=Synaphobranchus kaupii TaxID=118154 RepID=A0A9Q1J368_SYNKA|nr:hypothetical protein SKAU_G00139650 [Synaphobranchus kaupii]
MTCGNFREEKFLARSSAQSGLDFPPLVPFRKPFFNAGAGERTGRDSMARENNPPGGELCSQVQPVGRGHGCATPARDTISAGWDCRPPPVRNTQRIVQGREEAGREEYTAWKANMKHGGTKGNVHPSLPESCSVSRWLSSKISCFPTPTPK